MSDSGFDVQQVGVFVGHVPFGDPRRYWNFRSVGRGKVNFEGKTAPWIVNMVRANRVHSLNGSKWYAVVSASTRKYPKGWLAERIELLGGNNAGWRTDPGLSGKAGWNDEVK